MRKNEENLVKVAEKISKDIIDRLIESKMPGALRVDLVKDQGFTHTMCFGRAATDEETIDFIIHRVAKVEPAYAGSVRAYFSNGGTLNELSQQKFEPLRLVD